MKNFDGFRNLVEQRQIYRIIRLVQKCQAFFGGEYFAEKAENAEFFLNKPRMRKVYKSVTRSRCVLALNSKFMFKKTKNFYQIICFIANKKS